MPRGHVCPTCRIRLRVYKTREPAPGLVVRRRECPRCGFRICTSERLSKVIRPGGAIPDPVSGPGPVSRPRPADSAAHSGLVSDTRTGTP
jgi:hypothetical protein